MISPPPDLAATLGGLVQEYRQNGNLGALFERVKELSAATDPDLLIAASVPYRDLPEVVIPVYERVVAARPNDAQSMVVLANAYWLTGRGSDVVGALATRAISADAGNRGAWHLWALSEADPRARMERWSQVTLHFPADQLARAALADNATSVAGAEHDPLALDLAVATYESLLKDTKNPAQRSALKETLEKLRKWKL